METMFLSFVIGKEMRLKFYDTIGMDLYLQRKSCICGEYFNKAELFSLCKLSTGCNGVNV